MRGIITTRASSAELGTRLNGYLLRARLVFDEEILNQRIRARQALGGTWCIDRGARKRHLRLVSDARS